MPIKKITGFTIIEILIVIAVIGILSTFVTIAYSKFNLAQALEKDRALVSAVLNQARGLTLSSKDNLSHGVHFAEGSIILFAGTSYLAGAPGNLTFSLNGQVSIAAVLSGGGTDIYFERLTGNASKNGTVTLSLKSNPSQIKSITIFDTGIIQNN